MATTLLLLAMVAFMVWAIVHTERRSGWHQDELDAETYLAALREHTGACERAAASTHMLAVAMREALR